MSSYTGVHLNCGILLSFLGPDVFTKKGWTAVQIEAIYNIYPVNILQGLIREHVAFMSFFFRNPEIVN